jgi:biotin carboxyl carrier protein
MSAITAKVGKWEFEFKSAPRGAMGTVEVKVAGRGPAEAMTVRWKSDAHGIWIETPEEFAGFDLEGERDDNGSVQYRLLQRGGAGEFAGLSLKRAGETDAAASGGAKKALRIRSQMPGKIVRIQIKEGDTVQKGDALLVMEAMKMENEIRAAQTGVVKAVKVSVGQAVETGADLVLMDSQ